MRFISRRSAGAGQGSRRLSFERAGNSATLARLDLGGSVGAMRLALNAEGTGEAAHPAASTIRVAGSSTPTTAPRSRVCWRLTMC